MVKMLELPPVAASPSLGHAQSQLAASSNTASRKHMDASLHQVVEPVGLVARLVAEEDHRLAPVLQLDEVGPCHLDMPNAPEGA